MAGRKRSTVASRPAATAAAPAPVRKPPVTSTFQSFSGFGQKVSVNYDLSGNLDEQCRDAIKNGDVEGVNKLLNAGANASYVDHTGNSLLHLACMFNKLELVTALLSRGANPNEKNPAGETAIDLAPPALQHKIKQTQTKA